MPSLLVVTPPGPNSDALCAKLREKGFSVHVSGNGSDALQVALRESPDVILMDPALSAMDRWHAVKRLNAEPRTTRIPVLTLAADATSPAGLQRVLAKIEQTLGPARQPITATPPPISSRTDDLSARLTGNTAPPAPSPLNSLPPQASSSATPLPTESAHPPSFMPSSDTGRLLVVDDNALNRDMLSRRLQKRGYHVEVAEDGKQALELVARYRYDLVLLDWMMPGLSGIEVLQRLRRDYSALQLPVIMATAKSEAEDIVEALRLGANDYVTKPLNFDVVHARVRTQLGVVHAHRELAASESRYRALLENTGDMIVQYQADGTVIYVSPASRTLLGVDPDTLRARPFLDWLHPMDRRELEEQQRKQRTLPSAFTFIARMQRRDQSWIWVETSCRVLRDRAHGRVEVIQAACRDVTEHMDRLAGDEPPLPLGGDIMTHPGWRGSSQHSGDFDLLGGSDDSHTPAPAPLAPPNLAVRSVPVVLLTRLDGLSVELLDSTDREALAKKIGAQLLASLERDHA